MEAITGALAELKAGQREILSRLDRLDGRLADLQRSTNESFELVLRALEAQGGVEAPERRREAPF